MSGLPMTRSVVQAEPQVQTHNLGSCPGFVCPTPILRAGGPTRPGGSQQRRSCVRVSLTGRGLDIVPQNGDVRA